MFALAILCILHHCDCVAIGVKCFMYIAISHSLVYLFYMTVMFRNQVIELNRNEHTHTNLLTHSLASVT